MSDAKDSGALPFFGAKWACGLGGALLLGFAAVTASAIYDKAHLASLETVTEPTAVGDHAFVSPVTREPGMTVLTWNGRPLRLGDIKNVSASDPDMLKAGMDDSHAFFIYTWSIPQAAGTSGVYYVKARDGEYLKVLQ
jgi:hypothetical protein